MYNWVLIFLFFCSVGAKAEIKSAISVEASQFQDVSDFESQLDLLLNWKSKGLLNDQLSYRELQTHAFFETGKKGDYSFDIDPMVWRLKLARGHAWFGRTHPRIESGHKVNVRDAIGINWAQNQSVALDPRVSGWIGVGWNANSSNAGWNATVFYTPLYIPTSGSKLNLTGIPTGSRYTRLPPMGINLRGQVLETRYTLHLGNTKEIVLQDQVYAQLSFESKNWYLSFLGWSARKALPETKETGRLIVNSVNENVHVAIDVVPKFPRETFLGASIKNKKINTELQVLYGEIHRPDEFNDRSLTASLSLEPFKPVRVGFLNRWRLNHKEEPAFYVPNYENQLVWVELGSQWKQWKPILRWEQHIENQKNGQWISPRLSYFPVKNLEIMARVDVLAGDDKSYFGSWRHLDSVSFKVGYIW